MPSAVLVTAATRHGATDEIAGAIAAALAAAGVHAETRPLDDVVSLDGYDAVVLGSSVYMGRWLGPANDFVARHKAELRARPTWLFSSGPIGSPLRPGPEDAVDVTEIMEAISPREHQLFSGKLDRSALGFGERAVMRVFRAPEGDFRDWDEIRRWAEGIAATLER